MFRQLFSITGSDWKDNFILSIIATVVLCLLGPIELFQEGSLPITLQSLLIVLIPVLIGWKAGGIAIFLYLLLGAIGLPVFIDDSSGFDKFTGATGGFLIAFLIGGIVAGYIAEELQIRNNYKAIIALLAGHVIILGLGLPWMWMFIPSNDPVHDVLNYFAPMSLLKVAIAFLIVQIINRIVEKRSSIAQNK